MGPLYTVALYDGSVVHGGPLRARARIVQIAGSARASACVCGELACVGEAVLDGRRRRRRRLPVCTP